MWLQVPREAVPAVEGQSKGVVVDGLPLTWKASSAMSALAQAARQVTELEGVTAVGHFQLARGGWLLLYPDAEQASKFLQHGNRLRIRSGDTEFPINVHLPGVTSGRKNAEAELRQRQAYTVIPYALAQELTEEAESGSAASPKAVRDRQNDKIQLWLGRDEDHVRGTLMNRKGGILRASHDVGERSAWSGACS